MGLAPIDAPPRPRLFSAPVVLGLLLLALALTALNVHWSLLNQGPPASDDNYHLYASVDMVTQASGLPSYAQALSCVLLYPNAYPPLTYQSTLLLYGLLGLDAPYAPVASFFPFLALLGMSMYGIGATLGGRAVGWACAIVTLASPVVVDHARTYFIDMPATATLAFSVLTLLRSRGMRERGWSIGFGVSLALGLLTRWTHLFPLLPLLLAAIWSVLAAMPRRQAITIAVGGCACAALLTGHILLAPYTDGRYAEGPGFRWGAWLFCVGDAAVVLAIARGLASRRHSRVEGPLLNLVEALTIAALLSWPWYFYNGERVRDKLVYQAGVGVDFWQGVHAYLTDVSTMVYLAPVMLSIGVALGLRDPRRRAVTACLTGSLVLTLGLAALLPPDSRYVMPAIVFVTPLALSWAGRLTGAVGAQIGHAVLLTVTLVSLWQATAFEWHRSGVSALDGPTRQQTRVGPGVNPLYLGLRPALPIEPVRGLFPHDDVIDAICAHETVRPIRVAVLIDADDAAAFQPRTLLYRAALRGVRLMPVESTESTRLRRLVADVAPCTTFLVVYRTQSSRQTLMQMVAQHHWFDAAATPLARFVFSPDYRLELFRRKTPRAPGP